MIGLDGLEPRIVEPMLAAGELPNLGQAAPPGRFARVATTIPAQTPVAWSTFATGDEPRRARHLRLPPPRTRDLSARPRPEPIRAAQRVPAAQGGEPAAGMPVWATLRRRGSARRSCAARARIRPTRSAGGCSRAWASPDLRGGFGTSTFYTTADVTARRERERRARAASMATDRDAPDRPAATQGPGRLSNDAPGRRRPRSQAADLRSEGRPTQWKSRRAVERLAARVVQGRPAPVGPRARALPSDAVDQPSSRYTPRRSTSTPERPCSRSARRRTTPASCRRRRAVPHDRDGRGPQPA